MRRRPRADDRLTDMELAFGVPDGLAVLDGAGGIIGWDETAAHEYEQRHGMTTECDGACVARGHIRPQ